MKVSGTIYHEADEMMATHTQQSVTGYYKSYCNSKTEQEALLMQTEPCERTVS